MVRTRVAIAGAGIIGSSIAWKLRQLGIEATAVDPGPPPGQASWAGAGMLSPGAEVTERSAWSDLALDAAHSYAAFVAELEAAAGPESGRVDYRQSGAVEVAWDGAEAERLQRRMDAQEPMGIESRWLSRKELSMLVPALAGEPHAAAYYPRDAMVDARDVVRLLHTLEAPVRAAVNEIRASASGATVDTSNGLIEAEAVVLAAGAWSSSIPVRVEGEAVAIPSAVPVRGHLLGFRVTPGSLGPILRHDHTYLLQRRSGLLIAGTSEERVGFDARKDEAVAGDIYRRARRMIPSLTDAVTYESWIGFRPGIEASGPAMGFVGGSRLCLAYGHYRNGILMAPATAERVAKDVAAMIGD